MRNERRREGPWSGIADRGDHKSRPQSSSLLLNHHKVKFPYASALCQCVDDDRPNHVMYDLSARFKVVAQLTPIHLEGKKTSSKPVSGRF